MVEWAEGGARRVHALTWSNPMQRVPAIDALFAEMGKLTRAHVRGLEVRFLR